MKYIDPLPITCNNCGSKNDYSLEEIRSLQASCIKCGFSFEKVGVKINDHHKEVDDYFSKLEILIEIEDKFSIVITDEEAEKILSFQNILDVISLKTNKSSKMILSKVTETIEALGVDASATENFQELLSEFKYLKDS